MSPLVLASHPLCPYVQRAAIVLLEQGREFERREVDLAAKPDWFLRCSPLGKTPVLLVEGLAVFESAVICEYLEESRAATAPALYPVEPLARARARGWVEFGSAMLNAIATFYRAPDESALLSAAAELRRRIGQVEAVLAACSDTGPFFDGQRFGIVDAVFAPVMRYFDAFDRIADFAFASGCPRWQAWRQALGQRPSVRAAVAPDYPARLGQFLLQRGGALALRAAAHSA
ncbi:glutathione S-transferase family protein [Paucibacter sp. APW11]|uniref:Glutathione S-transferase family protein n=1 Tax=Roseateles aquae TaxID=3077235 RepID=A0ABU3PA16_9BURK|nr:glutathione S-transferase family protein [Paucibacter sp. APW11]MDT8999417.1 glutathione S-transferase family protein [Paucibacter sp. APW11]